MAPSHLVLIVLLSEANLAPLNQGRDGPFLQGPSLLNETQRHEGTRIMSKMDPQATPSSLAVLEAETQAGRAEGTSVSHRFLVLFLLQRLHCTSCEMGLLYPRASCSPLSGPGGLLGHKAQWLPGSVLSSKLFLQTCGDPLALPVRFSVHGSALSSELSLCPCQKQWPCSPP